MVLLGVFQGLSGLPQCPPGDMGGSGGGAVCGAVVCRRPEPTYSILLHNSSMVSVAEYCFMILWYNFHVKLTMVKRD